MAEPYQCRIEDRQKRKTDLKHATYIGNKQGRVIIAFEDCNLAYLPEEIELFIKLWNEGYHIADIMDALDRPDIETEILTLYLSFKNKIKPRPGGVLGTDDMVVA